jgi:hypothetical protein
LENVEGGDLSEDTGVDGKIRMDLREIGWEVEGPDASDSG